MGSALRIFVIVATLLAGCASEAPSEILQQTQRYPTVVELPVPDLNGTLSLEQALRERRSVREYATARLTLDEIGQLLWAGQGITDDDGHRTAPSAGARYPLELYAVTAAELMHYLPVGHRVEQRVDTTTLEALADAAFDQEFVGSAPLVVVIAADPARTQQEYGAMAGDLVNREAGHAAQNILLQAIALGLAAVPVGGFDPAAVERLLALPPGQAVLYLIPVGVPVSRAGDGPP
ncbi:MAG: SagB/ThcOx family dehydrogenase [Ilumatobacteraceae bacterium]|jgi:SagB-type dehydrogenase family enzyme